MKLAKQPSRPAAVRSMPSRTDVWAVRHGCYTAEPAQPFRTATIDQIQCGKIECDRDGDDFPGANDCNGAFQPVVSLIDSEPARFAAGAAMADGV